MSIEAPPDTRAQDDILESLAFHPSCDYRDAPNCADKAAWIVWSLPCPCGDGDVADVRYFCGPCWTYRNGVGYVMCRACLTTWPCMALIRRVERI